MPDKEIITAKLKAIRNPFTKGMQIPITHTIKRGVVRKTEHPTPEMKWEPYQFATERVSSVKLFHTAGVKGLVDGLTDKAQRLFLYMVYRIGYNEDFIILDPKRYMHKYGIRSETTYKMAKKELVDKSFIIATSYRQVYWINPEIFFRGSRINKYPECLAPNASEWHQ